MASYYYANLSNDKLADAAARLETKAALFQVGRRSALAVNVGGAHNLAKIALVEASARLDAINEHATGNEGRIALENAVSALTYTISVFAPIVATY